MAVFFAVAVACCLTTIDYAPYFRAPYYQQTMTPLEAELRTNVMSVGELAAGFGRVKLTPPASMGALPLAGYGARKGRLATGVHDDVFVKAIALRVGGRIAVFAGADALIVPREVTDLAAETLRRLTGLRREQIYLGATHTHSSLGGWGEGMVAEAFAGKYQRASRSWFANCLVTAVTNALADLQPAAFGHGSFNAPEFVRNRLVKELGRKDPEFSLAIIRQIQGQTAVLGSYSAHATVLSSQNMEVSGDYPGYWQRAIERTTGGMAVFLAGGVGSHAPVPGEPGFAGAEKLGEALATRAMTEISRIQLTNSVCLDFVGTEVIMPDFHVRLSDQVRLRPWLARRLLHRAERSFVQSFRVGNMAWISTPCDFSGELALDIKDALRARGLHGVVTSFNGDYVGYVIPARYYHLNGYEPRLMSFYGPNVPDYLGEIIRTITATLTGTPQSSKPLETTGTR